MILNTYFHIEYKINFFSFWGLHRQWKNKKKQKLFPVYLRQKSNSTTIAFGIIKTPRFFDLRNTVEYFKILP